SKNLRRVNADNFVILRTGTFQLHVTSSEHARKAKVSWFTSNKLPASQLIGNHYFPKTKIKVNWIGAYSKVNRDIPNMRRNIYTRPMQQDMSEHTIYSAVIAPSSVGNKYSGGMFWSYLEEDIKSFKAD